MLPARLHHYSPGWLDTLLEEGSFCWLGAGAEQLLLVPGFITAQSGRALIDGEDIRTFSIESLRRNVAFVFQEAVMFDDTVENNIRLGYPEASMQQIE